MRRVCSLHAACNPHHAPPFLTGGNDYVAVYQILVFDFNNPLENCVNVSILPDTSVEDDEVFTVNLFLTDPSVTAFRGSADVIIINDDGEWVLLYGTEYLLVMV